MSRGLKFSSIAGGLGTIGGVTGIIVLALQKQDLESKTKERLLKQAREDLGNFIRDFKILDKEIISTEKVEKLFESENPDTKEDVEKLPEDKLTSLKDVEGFYSFGGKNNLCDLIQKEVARRMTKENFKYALKVSDVFFFAFSSCILTNENK